MARNVLAYSDIFNSSGEQFSPEEFVVILTGSQIKTVLSFLESYAYWKSSWSYPTMEQWDIVDAFIADIYLRLGGEQVYQIAEKLNLINNTLEEMRDKMSDGSGGGDGSGNTIQDLIFWLKLLFAVTGAGGLAENSIPILGQIRDESELSNSNLATLNVEMEEQRLQLVEIASKLQGLIDKECQPLVQSVRLDSNITSQSTNLLRNGDWQTGESRGIENAFYPDYWLVVGEPGDSEFCGRAFLGGVYCLTMITETTPIVRQTAIIPPGYEMPKIVMTLPQEAVEFGAATVNVYVNNELTELSIVESSSTYFEVDFNAMSGDAIKVELTATGSPTATFGVIELLVWPTSLPVSSEVSLPTIGGSLGKGRINQIKPDKRQWATSYSDPGVEGNWIVDKLEALSDWFGLRLTEVKGMSQSLQAVRIFRMDSSTKICNVFFNTSMPDTGYSSVTVDVYNGDVWSTVKNCTVTGSYAIKVNFPEFIGDKLVRITLNPVLDGLADGDFWLYDMEIEKID